MLCPLGPKLNGVAPCGGGKGVGMGRVVRLGSLSVSVASPDGGGTKGLGCHNEASYSARQVSMRPGSLRVLGVPRLPDNARWGHVDLNYGRARSLQTYMELVGTFPMGQDRLGLRTDVGLTFLEVSENVAFPRDDINHWLASPGGFSLEGMKRPTAHDGSDENEDNPSFSKTAKLVV